MQNSLFLLPEQFGRTSLKGTSTLTQLPRQRGATSFSPAQIHQLLYDIQIYHLLFQGLFTDLRAIITGPNVKPGCLCLCHSQEKCTLYYITPDLTLELNIWDDEKKTE